MSIPKIPRPQVDMTRSWSSELQTTKTVETASCLNDSKHLEGTAFFHPLVAFHLMLFFFVLRDIKLFAAHVLVVLVCCHRRLPCRPQLYLCHDGDAQRPSRVKVCERVTCCVSMILQESQLNHTMRSNSWRICFYVAPIVWLPCALIWLREARPNVAFR